VISAGTSLAGTRGSRSRRPASGIGFKS
jgi:hypothetical protein